MSHMNVIESYKNITNRELALELTRLQVQLECAYAAKGYGNTPSVLATYEANLEKVKEQD